ELFGKVQKRRDVLRRVAVEDRGVDVDGEALGLGGLDARDGAVERTLLADRLVVLLAQAVEVHGEEQVGRRLEQVELLLEQERVGAERDELLAGDQALHDLAYLTMDQRLAA